MKIQFYNKSSGTVMNDERKYAILDNEVFQVNEDLWEDPELVEVYDFLYSCPDVGWKVIND